ncbi:Serine/threonine protein kinase, partial [Coemansia sp. RSA 1933]
PPPIQSRLRRLSSGRRTTAGSSVNPQQQPQYVDARTLSREVALYARIPNHSNIIRLERMLHTKDQLFMVMEHCSGGDLYENISTNPYFQLPNNDALIRRLFLQLVSALQHCHKQGVYHRDIKPENVLVSRDGLNVKLIDFGLSTNEPWCREIGCGSAYYMSPECQGGIHTKVDQYAAAPNDVWALGIILINLTTGRNPWNRAHIADPLFRRYLADKSFLCKAIRASPEFTHIIYRTLDVNPLTRCTIDELQRLVQACPRFIEPVTATRQMDQTFQKQQLQQSQPQTPTRADFQTPTAVSAAPQPVPSSAYKGPDQLSAGVITQAILRTRPVPQYPKQQQQQQHYVQPAHMQPENNRPPQAARVVAQALATTHKQQLHHGVAHGIRDPTDPFTPTSLYFDFSPSIPAPTTATSTRTAGSKPQTTPLFYPVPQPRLDPSPYVVVPEHKLSCQGKRYICNVAVAAAAAAATATANVTNTPPRNTPTPTALCGGGIC